LCGSSPSLPGEGWERCRKPWRTPQGQRLESHTKTFAEGGFPPKQIKPRPFEKGRGLEKRLKPLLMKKGLGLMEKPSAKREKELWGPAPN